MLLVLSKRLRLGLWSAIFAVMALALVINFDSLLLLLFTKRLSERQEIGHFSSFLSDSSTWTPAGMTFRTYYFKSEEPTSLHWGIPRASSNIFFSRTQGSILRWSKELTPVGRWRVWTHHDGSDLKYCHYHFSTFGKFLGITFFNSNGFIESQKKANPQSPYGGLMPPKKSPPWYWGEVDLTQEEVDFPDGVPAWWIWFNDGYPIPKNVFKPVKVRPEDEAYLRSLDELPWGDLPGY